MMQQELEQAFRSYSTITLPLKKIEVLAKASHSLTIDFRMAHHDGADRDILNRLNEVQHQLSSMIGALARESEKRYPDEVFFNVLSEKAGPRLQKTLLHALKNTSSCTQ